MSSYGFAIIQALVTDINPNDKGASTAASVLQQPPCRMYCARMLYGMQRRTSLRIQCSQPHAIAFFSAAVSLRLRSFFSHAMQSRTP